MACRHGKEGACAVCEELGERRLENERLNRLLEECRHERSGYFKGGIVSPVMVRIGEGKETIGFVPLRNGSVVPGRDEKAERIKVLEALVKGQAHEIAEHNKLIGEQYKTITKLQNQVKALDDSRNIIMSQRNHWVNECAKSDKKVRELQYQLDEESALHKQDTERLNFIESMASIYGVRHTLNLTASHAMTGSANVRTGIDRLIAFRIKATDSVEQRSGANC